MSRINNENIGILIERSDGEFVVDEPVSIIKYPFRHRDDRFDDLDLREEGFEYDETVGRREY
ncbi:hypothetical protein HYV88_02955 [Candidatus Woesearchaeota archaeon]|nr:hypothetical protein [Candidatus Woesearchaeota archaeon]